MTDTKAKKREIATRIRMAREMAGLSQAQVAKKIGVHRPAVSEVEAGRRSVSAEELAVLADLFDVDVSWLAAAKAEGKNPAISLAARELSKLGKKDAEILVHMLKALRTRERSRKR